MKIIEIPDEYEEWLMTWKRQLDFMRDNPPQKGAPEYVHFKHRR